MCQISECCTKVKGRFYFLWKSEEVVRGVVRGAKRAVGRWRRRRRRRSKTFVLPKVNFLFLSILLLKRETIAQRKNCCFSSQAYIDNSKNTASNSDWLQWKGSKLWICYLVSVICCKDCDCDLWMGGCDLCFCCLYEFVDLSMGGCDIVFVAKIVIICEWVCVICVFVLVFAAKIVMISWFCVRICFDLSIGVCELLQRLWWFLGFVCEFLWFVMVVCELLQRLWWLLGIGLGFVCEIFWFVMGRADKSVGTQERRSEPSKGLVSRARAC